jgi:tryptophan-rich hypothetical protein
MNVMSTNKFNPEKLKLSKWTAVNPSQKEKHWLVIDVIRDKNQLVVGCIIEAVINKREVELDFRALEDQQQWLQGWK